MCLRQAQVVLYDRLVHPRLLDAAPPAAERLDVGKQPARHHRSQAEINNLLIARAREGKVVVRLKGGDPFVFGQGGAECQALAKAGVPFEVVPGVSSAIAVPAYAGIPVTHRGFASVFTVITGHSCHGNNVQWESLPRQGTLIVLMGLGRLPEIAERLITHGWPADTPVAVIEQGTTDSQQVVDGSLGTIAERAHGLRTPATIVIGEVVALRNQISWFSPNQIRADETLTHRTLPAQMSLAER
jgi:uroporphyrin-III C-methyltransferase